MWPNPQESADLVTFTEEILNGKLHFFMQCEMRYYLQKNRDSSRWWWTNDLLEVVLLNINVDSVIDFCTEYVDSLGEIKLLKNQYKIQLKYDAEPVIHAPCRAPKDKLRNARRALKDKLRNERGRMKRLDIIE